MRDAFSLRIAVLALALGAVAAVAPGQEPKPADLTARGFATTPDGVQFTYLWRFHPGDDPAWAAPAFDDTKWETVEPLMPAGKLPQAGWPGVGWFRRHLRVEPALWGVPLAVRIEEAGTADIYLDGKLVHGAGPQAMGAAPEVPPVREGPWPIVFSARPEHVIAVRYSCAGCGTARAGIGFTLSLHESDAVAAARAAVARRTGTLLGALATVLVFVALLHGALYWFYRKMPENLFYALFMAAFAMLVLRDYGNWHLPRAPWEELLNRWMSPAPILIILLGQLTYYAVRTRPFPKSWKLFTAAAVVLTPAVFFSREPYSTFIWSGYFAAMLVDVVRIERSRRTVAREGVAIILVGMAVLAACIVLQLLVNFRVVPAVAGFNEIYVFGVLASVLTMSLFLARTFARTSLHLEKRLAEVETLTAQVLEQERAAHGHELRQRLLEAENARKSGELEAGRALQLSMLPPVLPEVEGLELAVAMSTASEVGGDYYDFRPGPGGSLVVAVGDATGHGVAAGILVTAVKALFATLGGEPGLAPMLAECDRVLRGMNLKHLHMCLSVARIGARSVTVCSAAMPPLLIWRAGSGRVEELGAGGLPLGGGLSPAYEERSVALRPGDTLLFATDGFPELLDPEGKPFGFEGVAEALRAAGGAPAREIVERLTAAAAAWRQGREQTDDITFVVVRVKA
ncbi:MAG: hypothetical protein B7Z68_00200 [Acidobacteria bacterium 21-70-11]|nr:MAG: hypothetical protein B7Z68_00200 [Acidobacteria bacterium 21-70-11]